MPDQNDAISDGLFLEYRVEGSTAPGQTRAATERLTFRRRPDGRFQVHLQAEEVPLGLYAAAYGDPILVDGGLVAANGRALQFRGLCPFLLAPPRRATDAEVGWAWDGAGVESMPDEPDQQLMVKAVVGGPLRWRQWNAWVLRRTDAPPQAPAPVAYYEQATGLLVGVEYAADLPGAGKFVYCDAELQDSSAGGPRPARG